MDAGNDTEYECQNESGESNKLEDFLSRFPTPVHGLRYLTIYEMSDAPVIHGGLHRDSESLSE